MLNSNTYELIRPFGPTIYHGVMSDELMSVLTKCAKDTREAKENVGHDLAGNIENQLQAVMDSKVQKMFMQHLSEHLYNYLREEWNRQQSHLITKEGDDPEFETMSFNLNNGPWINFQQANEFNPMHSHSGIISSVLYIDVPEEIAQEANDDLKTTIRCPGQIEFMYGPDVVGVNGSHKIIPKTGDILLFHAGLKHAVYPFKSNVERVSMSFNVWNVGHATKEGEEQ